MTAEDFVAKLSKPRRSGSGWEACCPAHEDGRQSLSVTEKAGKVLVHCHAGCSPADVCAAAGVKLSDLFADAGKNGAGRGKLGAVVAEYDYVDEAGKLLFTVVRFYPKDFRQRPAAIPQSGKWSMEGVRRVLFRLPAVLAAAAAGAHVMVCEGEKDVLAAEKEGIVATCNPGGADPNGKKWSESYTAALAGAFVTVIADKDGVDEKHPNESFKGQRHAAAVAGMLVKVCRRVRVVELPDVNGKPVKDLADFFAAGGTKDELKRIVHAAPLFDPAKRQAPAEPPRYPSVDRLVGEAIAEIEEAWRSNDGITGLSTGFKDLDMLTKGLQRGEMTVLGAFSSMGKSALAMNIAEHVALELGLPVGVFTLEMKARRLIKRMLSSQGRVNLRLLNIEHDVARLTSAAGRVAKARFLFEDHTDMSARQIRDKAKQMADDGARLLVVDYLQLMAESGASDSREREVNEMARQMKCMAEELNLPVLVLSQLNDDGKLRESRSIGQHTDNLWKLKKGDGAQETEDEEVPPPVRPVNLLVIKQRDGEPGVVKLTLLGMYLRFQSAARVQTDQQQ